MSSFTYRCSALAITLLCVMAGCRKSKYYCPGAPLDNCNYLDATSSCESNDDCSEPTAVCDVSGSKTCVQCVAPDQTSACSGATPACGDDHTCRGCISHAECPGSNVCLPDGSCADPGQVAYVQAGGTGAQPCTQAAPCGKLQDGVTAVNAGRPYIKISGAGTLADNATTTIDGKAVTILADPGAKLDRMGDGVILEVRNTGADVRIYDLEITGASGGAGDVGISIPSGGMPKLALARVKITNNAGGGISSGGGTLTVSQSTILGNGGGGISVNNGTFNITNNFIVRNGDELAGTFGGLFLGIATPGNNRLEFNTIVDNKAAVNSAGIVCNVPAFMAPNNIVARNNLAGSTTSPGAQTTTGGCAYPSSRIQNDVAGLMFEHPDPPGTLSYKLLLGSAAIDQATTPSDIVVDFEGQPRPSGAGKDIGADELQQ
jgi:hypothetical protein